MKKILMLFFMIGTLGYAEVGDYKSEFGVGVGLGFPSGWGLVRKMRIYNAKEFS